MDVDQFLVTNQPSWARLDELVGRAGHGVGRLSPSELEELVRLYQRVSSHLSYARTYYYDPALTDTLTRRVARANAVIYGTRSRTWRAIVQFLVVTFPAAVWHSRRFVIASAALLFIPALALGVWIANSTEAVNATAPAEVRQALIEREFEDYYSSEPAAAFTSKVFTNNVQVAILAFAFGVCFCLPTAFLLIYNGANVGVAAGLFAAAGQQGKFWGLILPHGLLELTAVCIAGAAGLRLGWSLIDPGDRSRSTALAEEGRRAIVIVVGLIGAFAVAGTIEGFVTGSGLPTWLRVGIGVAVEVAFLAYIVTYGRAAAARGLTGALGEERSSPWHTDDAPVLTSGLSP
ncbi:MAG TPA: stage II sporulation protein M [Acidimicrobiales bacterium]|nr:stage II sporulation protein M [Acidimicrobiales bacterium]